MSILLGALILALLLLPGILFRLGYFSLPFSSRSFRAAFAEELLFSLFPSFLLQALGYWMADALFGVRERVLLLLFLNSDKVAASPIGRMDVLGFTGYALFLGVLAYLAGAGFRVVSLRRGLHLKYSFLRIYSEWEIYFKGFILDYPKQESGRTHRDVIGCSLDVLVETKEGSVLYCGFLEKYVLTKEEKLDRIYLTVVRRRRLADDAHLGATPPTPTLAEENLPSATAAEAFDQRYYHMPGDYLMILGDQIRNVHITYYFVNSEAETEESLSADAN